MKTVLILLSLLFFSTAYLAQTPQPEHPGIGLYKKGKYEDAIRSLSVAVKQKDTKNDASIWNYLGLAYLATNDYERALKASKKAVALDSRTSTYRDNLAFAYLMQGRIDDAYREADKSVKINNGDSTAHYIRGTANLRRARLDDAREDAEKIIAIDNRDPKGYLLSSNITLAELSMAMSKDADPDDGAYAAIKAHISYLQAAHDILKKGIENSKGLPDSDLLKAKLESVDAFLDQYSKDPRKPTDPPEQGTMPVKILSKPKPSYTETARSANVQGTIRLAALLGNDGTVKYILLLSSLGYGLDEQAVAAARKIKFEPKLKDGKPIATIVILEYSFTIY